jgi:small ligand-binding sensory domain FIST
MPFAAALSQIRDTEGALHEACDDAREALRERPDLALVFFSPHHNESADIVARVTADKLQARCLLGCSGESIVGTDREVEKGPALSVWLGRWQYPMGLHSFHLDVEETSEGTALLGWPDAFAEADVAQSAVLLLGDPFTFPADFFLRRMNESHPGLRVMGGMASGAQAPGAVRLLRDGAVVSSGAVGVLLSGAAGVRSVVSQGCRPIGRHLVITRGQDNIIVELGGKPPLARLQEIWEELGPEERRLFQQGLHIGRVISEYQGDFRRGDFLVRNVLGIDRETGAMAVTDRVRVGQTVQFHVRDASTADEDLREMLSQDLAAHAARPAGGLLFTCNGRGTRLFPRPHHDAAAVAHEAGPLPLAGFFAQGELGPVRGQNFIHGFTASLVLFED